MIENDTRVLLFFKNEGKGCQVNLVKTHSRRSKEALVKRSLSSLKSCLAFFAHPGSSQISQDVLCHLFILTSVGHKKAWDEVVSIGAVLVYQSFNQCPWMSTKQRTIIRLNIWQCTLFQLNPSASMYQSQKNNVRLLKLLKFRLPREIWLTLGWLKGLFTCAM